MHVTYHRREFTQNSIFKSHLTKDDITYLNKLKKKRSYLIDDTSADLINSTMGWGNH